MLVFQSTPSHEAPQTLQSTSAELVIAAAYDTGMITLLPTRSQMK